MTKKIDLLADDGLLALKWMQNTMIELLKILQEFYTLSNLPINLSKSVLVPIGPNLDNRLDLTGSEFFLKVDIISGPKAFNYQYLGVPGYCFN